ncbi:unnamed protein product [Rangifer tarandus platyrhynchus]|uniref:Uncharacterized protein n=2 Tax=Rangifer tarandus platyrhynchus TaxID=3082113 RepID=A0ABN8YLT7_RANTA|nr:unnamed protein product [Rangifer tarandus platyrhynchus]CAI9697600.1 unnamed protein product [Rangifer tarandus platyrhynchus]
MNRHMPATTRTADINPPSSPNLQTPLPTPPPAGAADSSAREPPPVAAPSGHAPGVWPPLHAVPPPTPRPSGTAAAGAVRGDLLPRARTGRQGALPSPHPIVCKQTRQTAEAPALLDPQCLPPRDPSLVEGGEGRERGEPDVATQRALPPHCLSECTPATSSREPTRPGQSRLAGIRGAHTHPGGMNTPEGMAIGGGRLPSGGRARRAPLVAAAAALTAVAVAVAAAAAPRTAGASASWSLLLLPLLLPLLSLLLPPPPGARSHVALAASQAARRIPGPLGGRPAPPRPRLAGPTPRPRVTPRPGPPARPPRTSRDLQARAAPPTSARGVSLQPGAGQGSGLGAEARRSAFRTGGTAGHAHTDTLTQ